MRISSFPPEYETRLRTVERLICNHFATELRPLQLADVVVSYRESLDGWAVRLIPGVRPVILLGERVFLSTDDYIGECLMLALHRIRQGWIVNLVRWLELPDARTDRELRDAAIAWRTVRRRAMPRVIGARR